MLDSIIFCSTLARRDSLHSLRCRCTLFLSRTPTFVNWALPANKPRVMCRLFIKNMLEKHTPIKEPVFYARRGAGFGRKSRASGGSAACASSLGFGLLSSALPRCGSSQEQQARCWHHPRAAHPRPGLFAEPEALPAQPYPLKCREWLEQDGFLLMINAKSGRGIEQRCNTVHINYYFNTQPASAPSSRQFHKLRYGVNCGLVFQNVLCSKTETE